MAKPRNPRLENGHRARKRFGQNFLHDPNVIAKIVAAIAPSPEDHLVEIGPGQAALTQPLLDSGCRLEVIELDRDLIPGLNQRAQSNPRLTVHQGDALAMDFSPLAADGPIRVVGNLPYNISTPLLFHLFQYGQQIVDFHFMLQREVVLRMAAEPGSKTYGRLSVMTQFYCQVSPLFSVPPGAFNPPPKVTSMMVRLLPHHTPVVAVSDTARFAAVVAAAFSMRRKTLSNSLKALLSADQIRAAGVDPGVRAERVSLEQFAQLSNQLSGATSSGPSDHS